LRILLWAATNSQNFHGVSSINQSIDQNHLLSIA